jgi:O-antigen ligase
MWPLRTMAFFAVFVVMCALSLVHPLVGIVNYLIIYQMDPTVSWWGVPLATLGIRFSMTAALFLALGMLINWGRLPKVRPTICTWQALLILLVMIAMVSRIIGVEVEDWPTEVIIEKFIKLAIFVLCLTHLVTDRRSFNIVLWTLVCGALILGHDAYTAPPWQFVRGRLNDVGGPDFRASSGLAAHMAAMLPLIGVALLIAKTWKWRVVAILAGGFTVNTIVLCRTRSAFVALLVGAIAAILMAPRLRRPRVYAAILVAAIGSYSLTDQFFWDRMATLNAGEGEEDAAAALRRQIWATALVIIEDQPLGIGCGNFPRVIGDYNNALKYRGSHNTYLLCCAELGLHGAFVFLTLIITSFVQLYEGRKWAAQSRDPPESMLVLYGIALSIIVFLVASFFTERFYAESFWWVLALPTCYTRAVRREVLEPELEWEPLARTRILDDLGLWATPARG